MSTMNKKTIRSNKAQIKALIDYMHAHADFAAGEFKTPHGAVQQDREWSLLKDYLDELGPSRSVDQWKVCWRDQKRKARVEAGALRRAQNATGNHISVPELSANAAIVLDTIGTEMALGCGPEESPIGFSSDVSPAAAEITIPSPIPSSSSTQHTLPQEVPLPTPPMRRRVRRTLPSDRFINAQLELNSLIKELIKEVRKSNSLRKEQNMLLMRCSRRGRR